MKLLAHEFLPMDIPTYAVPIPLNQQMVKWIDETPGDGRIWAGGMTLYFELEQDATLFTLRWA